MQSVLIGRGRDLTTTPIVQWQSAVLSATNKMRNRLDFMTLAHHGVRNFVVSGLARLRRPIPIVEIAANVQLPAPKAEAIVEELERNLFFLVRNGDGDVSWGFPFTAEPTSHELNFSSGQRTYGACAEDAFAAAFVLGRLLRRPLHVDIESVCAESGHPLHLTISSEFPNSNHLLFVPSVDWQTFRAPNIIDDY
jgi:Alkylmercury lyase